MRIVILLIVLSITACAIQDRAPAGFKAYCEKNPQRAECGGKQ